MLALVAPAAGQDNPFAQGWTLVPALSKFSFESTKNTSIVETNTFSGLSGTLDADGTAVIKIQLNSIDTGIDLRNVRMRFLFFETFKFPELTISADVDPQEVSDLATNDSKQITLPVEVDLHGVKQTLETEVSLKLVQENQVSVSSVEPILIAADQFDLAAGVTRLEEAAGVTLLPSGAVSFELLFQAGGAADATTAAVADPRDAAMETKGVFTLEECTTRFDTMSRAEAIFFESGSARLDEESRHVLDEIIDIVGRCPGLNIQVSGHTDSRGTVEANQALSERRADSVHDYLVERGVGDDRMHADGFGEAQPAFPNDSARNRARNRRIEFSVLR